MDAKKLKKVYKVIHPKDTVLNKKLNYLGCVFAGFLILSGFIFYNISDVMEKRFPRRIHNALKSYYNSEEYHRKRLVLLGFAPPSKEVIQKAQELYYKLEYTSLTMNLQTDDLDDSALVSMSLVQKRKASNSLNHESLKHPKLGSIDSFLKKSEKLQENTTELFVDVEKNNSKLKLNESKSCYFESKKTMSSCPLCLKSFENESNCLSHTKQCAKKRKLTTQQLLSALELQKKHLKERTALGISIHPRSSSGQLTKKECLNKEEYDLALGLALSKSMNSADVNFANGSLKTTLEEFGFNNSTSTGKKKGKVQKTYVLRERTSEERQRLITEKAAVVLLEEKKDVINEMKKNVNSNSYFKNHTKYENQVPYLWNMGENEGQCEWYAKEIESIFKEEKMKKFEEKNNPQSLVPVENIQSEIMNLNLPKSNIYSNWNKMINNEKLSDLTGRTKDGKIFYLHSVVIYARYSFIMEKDLKTIFKEFNLQTILNLLEFLYCGTLNNLTRSEVKQLSILAARLEYEELCSVLNSLEASLSESSNEIIPSSLTTDEGDKEADITVIEQFNKVKLFPEDEDMFEGSVVKLTQGCCTSLIQENNGEEDESNEDKFYWSFLDREKETEEHTKKEDEKKETCLTQPKSTIQKILKNKAISETELEQDIIDSVESSEWEVKGSDDELKKEKVSDDCIILSSDSDSQMSKNSCEMKICHENIDYEIPQYDPYDDFNCLSPVYPPEDLQSQSFITGNVSFESKCSAKIEDLDQSLKECTTPLKHNETKSSLELNSTLKELPSAKKLQNKPKRKKCDLTQSRIIRKSLGLKAKNAKLVLNKRKSLKKLKKTEVIDHEMKMTNSLPDASPSEGKKFVEMTPLASKEFEDCITPSPNFSQMGESIIKEQLSKYGLKKSLGKSKARKILQHIYEELHPVLNTETGKFFKVIPNAQKKTRRKAKEVTTKKKKLTKKPVKEADENPQILNSSNESNAVCSESICSLDKCTSEKSIDHSSDSSETESIHELCTQSLTGDPDDLPLVFNEYLQKNSAFHETILLYEPIWLEEVQKNLQENFKKHFKLNDIRDYLDKQCITFRTESKRNRKNKKSTRKTFLSQPP